VNDKPFEPFHESGPMRIRLPDIFVVLRGVAGGIVGGVVGFFAVRWLAGQGMYGMMIPGALIGLFAGIAARGKSVVLGVVCTLAAVVFGIVIEWAVFPFVKDESFSFFLAHLHHWKPIKMVMIGLGAVFAFWLGQGR
jgi:hypothetical protein